MDMETILREIDEKKLKVVRFEQTDMNGIARSKLVPACNFKEKAHKGLNFILAHLGAGVQADVAEGNGYGIEIGYGDAVMVPDFDTFRVLPWLERTGRILIEPTIKGEFVAAHPRVVARRQLEKLKELGISLLSAHEFEFFLVDKDTMKPVNDDRNVHATIRDTPIIDLLCQCMEYLPQVGIQPELAENEYGPGMVEMSYKPVFGIRAGDNAHTYKITIKEVALLNGYVASFMTKPYPGECGSSGHFCHSLWDAEGKTPLLYDAEKNPLNLSEVGRHWIAGILTHAPAIEVLLAPTVNCLKVIEPGLLYPINATWGIDNRTCCIRVKINGPDGTYIENRASSAAGDPYISLAATVAAGMDGIIRKLELPPQVTGNATLDCDIPPHTPLLPTTMEDGLRALSNDKVICDALGEDFIKCFTAVKMDEVKREREAKDRGDENWDFDYFFYYM